MSRRGGGAKGSYKSTKVTIAHLEYITDILPSQDFTMQIDQAINPGLPFLFPWLNEMGKMFEKYRIIKLVFFFKSTSADAVLSTVGPSGSTSLGSLIMMCQYNVLSPPPLNKRDMLNNATAVSCKPSNSMSFTINPHAAYKTLFVRTPYTESGGDRRLYDHADFHLATEGMQASTGSIGELSVLAIMQFTLPTLQNNILPTDKFYWQYPVTPAAGGNSLTLLRVNGATSLAKLQPIAGSNIKGYIALDPDINSWHYYFGDSADEQIGAIYEVLINAKLLWDDAIVPDCFYIMQHPDVLAPNIVTCSGCELTTFLTDPGTSNTPVENPNLLTSVTIVPAPPQPLATQPHGIAFRFYVKILTRDAHFGIDTPTATNICNFRWFNSATGLPTAVLGATNFQFTRELNVTMVSAAQYS